jgi:hypothetical protein
MTSIPVAVPVSDMDFPKSSAEEYELEQKREALYRAEQDLMSVIAYAEDFFATPTEKEEALQRIKNNPDAILTSSEKPFMKKIARVMVAVATLTKEVEEATEMVADQHLTPAQVKAHIIKVCKEQQVFLEKKMEERLLAEQANTKIIFDHMQMYFERKLAEQKTYFECQLAEQKAYFERQVALDRAKMDKALEADKAREAQLRSLSTDLDGQRKTVKTLQDQVLSLSTEVNMKSKEIKVLKSKLKEFSEDVYMMIWLPSADDTLLKSLAVQHFILRETGRMRPAYTDALGKRFGMEGRHPSQQNLEKIASLKIVKHLNPDGPSVPIQLVDFDE